MKTFQTAIVGATGFTGIELTRILSQHPRVELAALTSESKAGQDYASLFPQFRGLLNQTLISYEDLDPSTLDIVFLALPHRVSMSWVKAHLDWDIPIIDLSGDFRLDDAESYKEWYDKTHVLPDRVGEAAYGLPELHEEAIAKADLIANPGCFPTASILPLAPLMEAGWVDPNMCIIDAKTGVTGAGAKSKPVNHFSSVHDNFKAYGVKTHRHSIEIQQQLNRVGKTEFSIQFTPHLLPIDRGILSTCYTRPTQSVSDEKLYDLYRDFYQNQPFIRLVDQPPSLKQVRSSNFCDIYLTFDERTGHVISMGAIDNLVKGAAGQAVHNMNLRLGLSPTDGLQIVPLQP